MKNVPCMLLENRILSCNTLLRGLTYPRFYDWSQNLLGLLMICVRHGQYKEVTGDIQKFAQYSVMLLLTNPLMCLFSGYVTARSNRPDIARAANHLMRMALEGRITLSFVPPNFNQDDWTNHEDMSVIDETIALSKKESNEPDLIENESEEDSDSDDSEDKETDKSISMAKNKFIALSSENE